MNETILSSEDFFKLSKLPDKLTNRLKWAKLLTIYIGFLGLFAFMIIFVTILKKYELSIYGLYYIPIILFVISTLCALRIVFLAIRKRVSIFDIVELIISLVGAIAFTIAPGKSGITVGIIMSIVSSLCFFGFILSIVDGFVSKVKFNKKLPCYDSFVEATKDLSKKEKKNVIFKLSECVKNDDIEGAASLLKLVSEYTNEEYIKAKEEITKAKSERRLLEKQAQAEKQLTTSEMAKEELSTEELGDSNEIVGDSEFKASSFNFFLHLLFWNFLTVVTFGVAKPYIITMRESYLAKRTWTNGKKNKFDGNGAQLIGQYLIWLLLTIITCGIYSIFLTGKLIMWKTKHTHFVGSENKESKYDGSSVVRFFLNLGLTALSIVTLTLMQPFKIATLNRYDKEHSVIDGHRLRFDGTAMGYFGNHIIWTLLTIVTFGIYYIFVPLKKEKWIRKNTHIAD